MRCHTVRYLSALALIAATGCGDDAQCDAEGLTSVLEGASSGDVVRIGACRIAGDFVLPAGVTLQGEEGSVVAGRIDLSSGRVENLTVESTDAGIVAEDGGTAAIHDVEVNVTTGVGIAADNIASLDMQRVTIRGPIDASNISSLYGTTPNNRTTATHGLILVNVQNAMLSEISTRGFARFGALLKDSATQWTGGDANGNAWVGIMVEHGSGSISDVEVNDTMDVRVPHSPAFAVVTATAAVETTRLSIQGSDGFGLFHLIETAMHEDVTVTNTASAGIWLEGTTRAEIRGELADNEFGAIFAILAQNVIVRDTMIRSTSKVLRVVGDQGVKEAGDGIQLVDSMQGSLVENTTIAGNDRAGIVIALFGRRLEAGLFDNVTVTRDNATENGVLVQGGSRSSDWDTGLTRDSATEQADEAFTDLINPVGAVGPCFVPRN